MTSADPTVTDPLNPQGGHAVVPARKTAFLLFANAGTAELKIEFRPAQQQLRFFANYASLAAHWTTWFSSKGEAHFLLIALVLHTYCDHLYLAKLPILVQKILFAVVAPLARLRGYRMMIEPARQNRKRVIGNNSVEDVA